MTAEETEELRKLSTGVMFKDDFWLGARCGFALGKLSAMTYIINHSPLYNGEFRQRLKDALAADGEKRVEAQGKEGDTGPMHGKREDEDSAGRDDGHLGRV